MAKLMFISGDHMGREHSLNEGKTRVGRGNDNELVIDDLSVSRLHGTILKHGSEVIVRDLQSHNGVYVEGSRIAGQRALNSGQTVRFGSIELRLKMEREDRIEDPTTLTATHEYAHLVREEERRKQASLAPALEKRIPSPYTDAPTIVQSSTAIASASPLKKTQLLPVPSPRDQKHPGLRLLIIGCVALVVAILLVRLLGGN